MGDMADDARDAEERREWEFYDQRLIYFSLPVEELVKETAQNRLPICVSIRRFFKEKGYLTEKQKWVLATWLAMNEPEEP